MKNRKLKAIMGVSLAVMLAVPVSVFGISGAFGSSPKAQQSQTTASPLGLNPETDPVIMTTESGIEIRLGGADLTNNLNGYAYITTTVGSTNYNWVIIGYNNVTSLTVGDKTIKSDTIDPIETETLTKTETETAYTIDTFDKYAKIEGLSDEYKREKPDPHSGSLSQSPITYDPNDLIMNAIANDPVTWYQINYTHEVEKEVTIYKFPNAVNVKGTTNAYSAPGVGDLAPGEILCFAEDVLKYSSGDIDEACFWLEYDFGEEGSRYSAYYTAESTDNLRGHLESIYANGDYGLSGLKENMVPITLTTAWCNDSDGLVNDKYFTEGNDVHKTAYLFPMATTYGQTDPAYTGQNFLMETYFIKKDSYFYPKGIDTSKTANALKAASDWWLRSGYDIYSGGAGRVKSDGSLSSFAVSFPQGVRPAFVLKI